MAESTTVGQDNKSSGEGKIRRLKVDLSKNIRELAHAYQRELEHNPQQPEALVAMSLIALASRQTEAAIKLAMTGVKVAPQMITAWVTLGQALKSARQYGAAEEAYQHAIRQDGMDSLARRGLGDLLISMGRPEEAIREFKLALQRRPDLVSAYMGWGSALACLGRNQEALDQYEKALALQPRMPEGEFAAGFVLAKLGKVKEAERRYRRALNARPDFAAAWLNLGSLLRDQGSELYAAAAMERAVALRPDMITGWVNLASLEKDRKQPEKAEEYLRRAFALDPDRIETIMAWCHFRAGERDQAGAWEWLRWAYARNPDYDEAVNMHGILLHTEARFEEAVKIFERAEALGCKAAASNRGNSLLDLGRMEEALRAQQLAVERDPHCPGAQYNLALTQLRLGHWREGWTGYEARWRFREVHRSPRFFRQPRWQGEPLNGKRVLLHTEQGLGDTIQFCRYVMLVAARGGYPILQVQNATERLVRSLAAIRAGQAETAAMGSDPVRFDLECPLLSLPAVFRTTVETVPWPGAYLGADPELAREKRQRLPSRGAGPRVGLAWAGNPKYKADRQRSTRIATFLPLLRAVDATWISLQKGEAVEQLAGLPGDVFVYDGSSQDVDLAETAATLAGLDLVVTTDTCIAHLAGAMDKPVWMMLPYLSDWRWMQEIETSPWYPSMRLFRQKTKGDWSEVIERIAAEFERRFAAAFACAAA
jgi:tetratricopeptide (TPR) repeat protein